MTKYWCWCDYYYDRFEEAIEYLEMLVHDHPDHIRAQSQLATCYMQANRTNLAKATFDLVLQIEPMDPVTLQNYGKYYVLYSELPPIRPHLGPEMVSWLE